MDGRLGRFGGSPRRTEPRGPRRPDEGDVSRARARELAEDADHEAEKMADATPSEGLADERIIQIDEGAIAVETPV